METYWAKQQPSRFFVWNKIESIIYLKRVICIDMIKKQIYNTHY